MASTKKLNPEDDAVARATGIREEPLTAEDERALSAPGGQNPATRLREKVARGAQDDPGEAEEPPEHEEEPLDASNDPEPVYGEEDENAEDDRGVPLWAARAVPDNYRFPKGIVPTFVRLRAELTRDKVEHVIVMWELDVKDEHLARKRTRGDSMRTFEEMTKQCIRLFDDGILADWGGKALVGAAPGNVDKLWNAIGAKYRQRLIAMYLSLHSMSATEAADFFQHCVKSRHAVG